jgi:hypothetical protein
MFDEMDKHIIDLDNISCIVEDAKMVNLKEFRSRYQKRECSIQPLVPMGIESKIAVGSQTSLYCAPRLLQDGLEWEDQARNKKIANQVGFS